MWGYKSKITISTSKNKVSSRPGSLLRRKNSKYQLDSTRAHNNCSIKIYAMEIRSGFSIWSRVLLWSWRSPQKSNPLSWKKSVCDLLYRFCIGKDKRQRVDERLKGHHGKSDFWNIFAKDIKWDLCWEIWPLEDYLCSGEAEQYVEQEKSLWQVQRRKGSFWPGGSLLQHQTSGLSLSSKCESGSQQVQICIGNLKKWRR